MSVLKMIKKNKSWNISKYVVAKASLETMPKNLEKTKSGANVRHFYMQMLSLPHYFFW